MFFGFYGPNQASAEELLQLSVERLSTGKTQDSTVFLGDSFPARVDLAAADAKPFSCMLNAQ